MKTIVISLGGSIIVPDDIDVRFLKNFRKLILASIKKGNKFAIYCGGGSIARKYQKAVKKILGNNKTALDWIGISATYLNAFLMKTLFHRVAENYIVENPTKKINFKKPVLVCCGWKPGWSTDYDSVLLAKNLKAKTIINITDVNYVYDKDPKKYKNPKPIKELTWNQYLKIAGSKWEPGLNAPFDPIAAKAAKRLGTKVIIVGKNLKNLANLSNNRKFRGTIIK